MYAEGQGAADDAAGARDGGAGGAVVVPGSAGQALAVMGAALDYLAGPGMDSLEPAALGGVLEALGGLSSRLAAARATILARFDAAGGPAADGYGSATSWLAAKGRMTRRAAGAQVRQMRQYRDHPVIAAAVAAGDLSESWAAELADWTRRLPPEWRADVDRLLAGTAAAGAELEDLAVVAQAAYEKWRQAQGPDPDDGLDDRYLKLGATIDNAGRVTGSLTPQCTAALQAVLDALGKKAGPEDERTDAQRYHDALQLACELLIRARMVPDRAGAGTRVDAVISLAELLNLPGASQLQEAWLAAMAGQPGYLAGTDAEVIACDAAVRPVVTGHPDLSLVDAMIDLASAYLGSHDGRWPAGDGDPDDGQAPATATGTGDPGAGDPAMPDPAAGARGTAPDGPGRPGRPVASAVARGVAGAAVRDGPPRGRPRLRA